LLQLLVDFRRVDFRQQLAGFHMRADVHQPALEVSIGAGIDGRVGKGLHVGRKNDFLRFGGALGLDHQNAWHCHLTCLSQECG